VLAVSGLFGLFTVVMTGSSLQFVFLNLTSIENLQRETKIWTLAVYIPHPPPRTTIVSFQTITYPLNRSYQNPPEIAPPSRTFAILHSKPGESPFDLGYSKNFQSVMGHSFLDWVLPIRYSPLCDHSSGESAFPLGPVIQRMRQDAGIDLPRDSVSGGRRHRRRSRRHSGVGAETLQEEDEIQEKIEREGDEIGAEPEAGAVK